MHNPSGPSAASPHLNASRRTEPPDDGLGAYINLLHGFGPGYVEVRYRRPGGMGQEFLEPRDPRLQPMIRRLGETTDVYVGAALRTDRNGTRDAVGAIGVLWADLDSPEALEAYREFRPRATMEVRSGTDARLHVYWSMQDTITVDDVEQGNRKLAHKLAADIKCAEAARILRPPGTLNHKHDPPAAVTISFMEIDNIYTLEQVVGDLPDPHAREVKRTIVTPIAGDDPLRSIPPAVYVEMLSGQEVGRDGKIVCPFHADTDPSLQVNETYWHCFGCERGGTIIDFGAALYNLTPRGADFHEIRRRLVADVLAGVRRSA